MASNRKERSGAVQGNRGIGRKKGTPNKATKDIKALAQVHGPDAIKALAAIMKGADQPPAARVAAAKELIDRGYGRASQTVDVNNTDGSLRPLTFAEFYAGIAASTDDTDA